MSYTLDAVDVPAPIKLDSLRLRSGLTPLAAQSIAAGQYLLSTPFNKNAVYLDQLSSIGGSNICAIDPNGLAMSTSAGLTIDISAGLAFCGGAVEVSSAQQLVLTGGIRNYVWVQQDGTITRTSTITPPATYCCYIGSVLCGASTITSYDLSGVLYMQGGQIIRYTGDATVPGDTPPAGLVFYTVTDGGTYLWNGSAYCVIYPVSTGVPVDGVTIDYNGSGELEVISVPASLITGSLSAAHIACDGTTIHNSGGSLAVIVSGLTGIADSQLATAYIKQDGTRAMAADLSLGANKITNVTDPTNPQDAATKAYVDAVASGLDLKASCRLATAAALPSNTFAANALTATANGALTVDGVAVTAGDRILVKDEATALRNGIYSVTQAGSGGTPYILTRATDADSSAEVTSGMFCFVSAGSTYTATSWALSTADPITLNTTALTFVQFAGAGSYSAGTGLTLTGSVFSANIDSTTITLTGGGALQVGAISAAKITSGSLAVAQGGTALTALGTANQMLGANAGASALEYKSILGTSNQITVTHAAGSITLSTPQSIATSSTPQFLGLGVNQAFASGVRVGVTLAAVGDVGVKVTGIASQTGDFFQFLDSSANKVFYLDSANALRFVNPSGSSLLYNQGATGAGTYFAGRNNFATSGQSIGNYAFRDDVSAVSYVRADILTVATQNHDATHGGTYVRIATTPDDSITRVSRLFVRQNGDIELNGNEAALATSAVAPFVFIGTMPGPPTGTPSARTGNVAMVYNSTDGCLDLYNTTAAAWNGVGTRAGVLRTTAAGSTIACDSRDTYIWEYTGGVTGDQTYTLPAATTCRRLTFIYGKSNVSTNNLVINRAGSDTITIGNTTGATSATILGTARGSRTFVSNGVDIWYEIATI